MPSSTDGVRAALEGAASTVLGAVADHPGAKAPVVLIDGRSGAGKSTLAAMLRERWRGAVRVVALDDLYPGWDGLARGAEAARRDVVEPHAAGRTAQWHRWDWAADAYGAEVEAVSADTALIIEGSGVLTPASATLADVRVWLESPAQSRRHRALGRDGDTYRPHWERWAAQEDVHLAADDPRALADIVVDVP
ncbi:hypothetical protein [Microbacterium sp.]|uniref:hypothetical protein n=1 Tax=Microbacterium sp. TaxID=51671 RepID=UPI0039E704A9